MLINMYQVKLRIYQGTHDGKNYIIHYNMIAQNSYKKQLIKICEIGYDYNKCQSDS